MKQRREILKTLCASPLLMAMPSLSFAAETGSGPEQSVKRPLIYSRIPSSGEKIPAIGMGSYQTFNVAPDEVANKENLSQVLATFFNMHGCLIDSSPMYGRSESVIGELVGQLEERQKFFAASKVWTYGKEAGIKAVETSRQRMQVEQMDLMQVHNLRDWQVHLPTLQSLKSEKKIRYTGITTSFLGQYADFEAVMKSQPLDFVQLNYNIKIREAERRLLPLAMDKGMAVIVNMPYEKGRLFKLVKGKALPEWAKEFDCDSWGQYFLKFILSHPAVTCAIPATSKVKHMQDNMMAMTGRLPDAKMRQQMLAYIEDI
ncbi:aldo/keto reductase [Aliikangiella sp. G2MR2-5]|uniref:aldo/keto reductase n=1 Tax=Aliikangiella sp. G2MR2-5 TaxID=2788943 RepID=UPI0018AA0E92|nr:aldo/keto reductase [Aliikangiella sp. G2MR2-5]